MREPVLVLLGLNLERASDFLPTVVRAICKDFSLGRNRNELSDSGDASRQHRAITNRMPRESGLDFQLGLSNHSRYGPVVSSSALRATRMLRKHFGQMTGHP